MPFITHIVLLLCCALAAVGHSADASDTAPATPLAILTTPIAPSAPISGTAGQPTFEPSSDSDPYDKDSFIDKAATTTLKSVKSLRPTLNTTTAAEGELPSLKVSVQGGNAVLRDNIKATLATVYVRDIAEFAAAKPRLRKMARTAAQAVGFYNTQFDISKVGSDRILVKILQSEGVNVRQNNMVLLGEAQTDPAFARIVKQYQSAPGSTLNQAKYEQTKADLNQLAKDKGYFDAQWQKHQISIDADNNTADIDLVFDSGVRYKFGDITYSNTNTELPPPLKLQRLQQLTALASGDYYDNSLIAETSRQLGTTRYFSKIKVNAQTPVPLPDLQTVSATTLDFSEPIASRNARRSKLVPISIMLSDEKPNSAEIGAGYGTDTSFRIRGQYRRGLVNYFGHSFESSFEASAPAQRIDLRYQMPYKHPITDTFAVFGGVEREETKSNGITLVTLPVTIGAERTIKPLTQGWQKTLSLRYFSDQIESSAGFIADPSTLPSPYNINGASTHQQALLLGSSLSRLYLGNGVDPSFGFKQFYQLELADKKFLSDASMLIGRIGYSGLLSFGSSKAHQVAARADLGAIYTNNFDQVPFKLRYFAGGDLSVRGFDYRSLSPSVNGYLVGGQYLATTAVEYNYRVMPKLRLATFVDTGNTYAKAIDASPRIGVGFGLRYLSPIGTLRLDLASGLTEDTNQFDTVRLHFFIGPSL